MSLIRRLASQTAIYGMSSIVGRVINWALTPLYVNALRMEDFGVFSDIYALTFFPLIVLTFGMETSFFRFAQNAEHSDQAYANSFLSVTVLGLSFGLLGYLLATPIAGVLGYANRPELIQLAVGIIVLDVLAALPMARLRQREKSTRFAIISIANILVTLVLTVLFLAVWKKGVEWAFAANVIASGLRLVMALVGNMPRLKVADPKLLRQMLGYGMWIMLAGLLGAVNETLSRALLPRMWTNGQVYAGWPRTGLEMNAIFAANYKLAMLISLVVQAFRYAAEPFFFRHAQEEDSPKLFARVFHYFIVLGLVVYLLVGSLAFDIVSFNFWGLSRYRVMPPTYWVGLEVLPLLLLANLALGAYVNFSVWFKLTGQLRIGLYLAAIGGALTIGINVLTIPILGYMGSALATLVCYTVMAALAYFLGQVYYPVPYRWARPLTYLALFTALVWLNSHSLKLHFEYKAPILVVVLLAVFWFEKTYRPKFD
jgi:O-antigen/teichoic acid export membrane protein